METVRPSAFRNINHYMVQRHTEGRRFNKKTIGEDLTFIKYIQYRSVSCMCNTWHVLSNCSIWMNVVEIIYCDIKTKLCSWL